MLFYICSDSGMTGTDIKVGSCKYLLNQQTLFKFCGILLFYIKLSYVIDFKCHILSLFVFALQKNIRYQLLYAYHQIWESVNRHYHVGRTLLSRGIPTKGIPTQIIDALKHENIQ